MKNITLTAIIMLFTLPVVAQNATQSKPGNSPVPDCGWPMPAMVMQQPESQTICPGHNVVFTSSAFSNGVYSWQMSADSGVTWTNSIANSTSIESNSINSFIDSLIVTGVSPEMNGYQFRCVYRSFCGSGVITNTAILNVGTYTTSVISQPSNITTCKYTSADFTVEATGSSLTYQWQQSNNAGSNFTDIAGKRTKALHFDSVILNMNNNQYRCIINSECVAAVISSQVILSVRNDSSAITNQISNKAVCIEDTAILNTAATGNNVTYQWQGMNISGIYSDLPNEVSSILYVPYNDYLPNYYRCKISSTCKTLYTNEARIYYLTNVELMPAWENYGCDSETIELYPFLQYSTSYSYQYHFQWQYSADNGNTFSNLLNDTLDKLSITISPAVDNYKYRCYLTGVCFTGYSNIMTIHVNTPVSIINQPENKKGCSGFPVTFDIKATGSIYAYHWDQSTDGGITFSRISDAAYKSSYTIYNVAASQNNYQYRCKISSNCFDTLTSIPVTLNVYGNPEAGVDTSINVNCDSCTANIAALHDTAGYSEIQWSTTNPERVKAGKYKFIVFNNPGCYDSAFNYVNVLIADTLRICYGGIAQLNAPVAGSNYQWQLDYGYGQGFNSVNDDGLSIFGATSPSLVLKRINSNLKARCIVDGNINIPIFIRNTAYWTGIADSNWSNAANWSCGQIPDLDTDVIILNNTPNMPEVMQSTGCKKLTIQHSNVIIRNGRSLIIRGGN